MDFKLPTSIQVLPHSFEEIKFPVNRISDNTTFNSKLTLLNNNFDTLLSMASVVDNNLPFSHEGIYSFESEAWSIPPTTPTPSTHNYIDIVVVEKTNTDYLFICATKTQLDIYTTNIHTGLVLLTNTISYTYIKDRSQQSFRNIEFIKYNDEKLYVYDSVLETIMVYNILALISDDTTISSIKFLKQFFKLKNLINIDFKYDIYAITDTSILIYNQDLNLKTEYTLEKQSPIDILLYDNIYILYNDTIHVYNFSGTKTKEYELLVFDSEQILNISLSKVDDNIFYVQSKNYIYKYTIEGEFVGWFNIGSTMGGDEFTSMTIYSDSTGEYDQVFALDQTKLHYFKDKINIVKLYDEINMEDIEDLGSLYIKNQELEQDFVYNNILQKMVFNNLLLYNSLVYKAMLVTDEKGVLIYSHSENLVNTTTININPIFYGQNEVFSFQTFNRAFREIYNIQEKILELLNFDITENTTNTLII
jgi:hypothetical protein